MMIDWYGLKIEKKQCLFGFMGYYCYLCTTFGKRQQNEKKKDKKRLLGNVSHCSHYDNCWHNNVCEVMYREQG